MLLFYYYYYLCRLCRESLDSDYVWSVRAYFTADKFTAIGFDVLHQLATSLALLNVLENKFVEIFSL